MKREKKIDVRIIATSSYGLARKLYNNWQQSTDEDANIMKREKKLMF
jgi:hypothetical protein